MKNLKYPILAKLPEPETPEYKAMLREIEKWENNLDRPLYVVNKDGKRKRINPHPRWTRFWLKLSNNIDFFLRSSKSGRGDDFAGKPCQIISC